MDDLSKTKFLKCKEFNFVWCSYNKFTKFITKFFLIFVNNAKSLNDLFRHLVF